MICRSHADPPGTVLTDPPAASITAIAERCRQIGMPIAAKLPPDRSSITAANTCSDRGILRLAGGGRSDVGGELGNVDMSVSLPMTTGGRLVAGPFEHFEGEAVRTPGRSRAGRGAGSGR